MPFANSSGIQAQHIYNYFGGDGTLSMQNMYRGYQPPTLGFVPMPDCPENSTFPASGAIQFSNFTGKHKMNSITTVLSVGQLGVDYIGYLRGQAGSLSVETFTNGLGHVFRIDELSYVTSGAGWLTLTRTSGPTWSSAQKQSNISIWRIRLSLSSVWISNIASSYYSSGSGNVADYNLSGVSNPGWTVGNNYNIRLDWVE